MGPLLFLYTKRWLKEIRQSVAANDNFKSFPYPAAGWLPSQIRMTCQPLVSIRAFVAPRWSPRRHLVDKFVHKPIPAPQARLNHHELVNRNCKKREREDQSRQIGRAHV